MQQVVILRASSMSLLLIFKEAAPHLELLERPGEQ
jgi:hypothetical protein